MYFVRKFVFLLPIGKRIDTHITARLNEKEFSWTVIALNEKYQNFWPAQKIVRENGDFVLCLLFFNVFLCISSHQSKNIYREFQKGWTVNKLYQKSRKMWKKNVRYFEYLFKPNFSLFCSLTFYIFVIDNCILLGSHKNLIRVNSRETGVKLQIC